MALTSKWIHLRPVYACPCPEKWGGWSKWKKSNKNRPERTNIQRIIGFDDAVARGRDRTVQRVKWGKLYTNVKNKADGNSIFAGFWRRKLGAKEASLQQDGRARRSSEDDIYIIWGANWKTLDSLSLLFVTAGTGRRSRGKFAFPEAFHQAVCFAFVSQHTRHTHTHKHTRQWLFWLTKIFLLLILGSSSHRWRSATVQCFVVKQMKEFPRIKEGNVNKRETDTKNERGRPGGWRWIVDYRQERVIDEECKTGFGEQEMDECFAHRGRWWPGQVGGSVAGGSSAEFGHNCARTVKFWVLTGEEDAEDVEDEWGAVTVTKTGEASRPSTWLELVVCTMVTVLLSLSMRLQVGGSSACDRTACGTFFNCKCGWMDFESTTWMRACVDEVASSAPWWWWW